MALAPVAAKEKARPRSSVREKLDSKELQQVSLYLPNQLYERLKVVQEETDQSSMNDVVKSALRLYITLLEEAKLGNEVYVLSPDGTKTRYPVFMR